MAHRVFVLTLPGLAAMVLAAAAVLPAATTPPATELRGRVVDENSVAVSGVEVVLRAPDHSIETLFTDTAGQFTIRLPAAGSYRLSLSKPGFFRVADHAVELTAGENELTFTLSHEFEVHEEVEVTSSPNRIDPQQASHQDTLVAHQIRDIPVPSTHDLANSLPALPELLRDNSGELHLAGARPDQAAYMLDGFEVGDPFSGGLTARVNVDAVREATIEAGRYGAQYAHAAAGLLLLDTTVGDDRWRFGTTNFVPTLNLERGVHFGNWYPRFTLSGPLRRGRAWFSEAVSIQRTFHLFKSLPPGQDTTSTWAGDNLLRAQFNLSPGHILQASFLYNQLNSSRDGLGPFTPMSTTTSASSRRYFVSLRDQIWWRGALLELGVAADTGHGSRSPQGTLPYVLAPTGASGNYFEGLRQRSRRWQWLANLSLPSRHWLGAHDFSAGFNAARVTFTQDFTRGTIRVLRADGTLFEQSTFTGSPTLRLADTQVGGYVQDSWRVARPMVVQLGARADWESVIGRALVTPRVALNLLPFRDDRAKLALAWGIYAPRAPLPLLALARGQQQADVFYDSTGAVPVAGPLLSQFLLPPGGLQPPRFYTASLEWRQRFARSTFVGLHLLSRDGRRGLAYEDLAPGQPGATFLLRNQRRDRYRAAELSMRHSFGERAEFFAGYTRSRARSSQVIDESLGALLFSAQASGPLAWDAPNRVVSWGWAPAPFWHLLLSYFVEYRSGYPFSTVNQEQQLVGPPNRLRFPDYISLNLGIEKRFRLRGHEWAVRLAGINVTGHQNPNAVLNNVDASNFLTFAGGQGRALTARLRLIGRR